MSGFDPTAIQPGQLLLGKYRVDKTIGVGGMGVVVAATHELLHQRVAIKMMLSVHGGPESKKAEEARARFLREAQAASSITSEHSAKVTDVGVTESGSPYMVMEYLSGRDLSHVLEQQGPLPIEQACRYVMQACEALAEAHRLGIVHRDIKPANLFVTARADGTDIVKVLDFGIAKAKDGLQTRSAAAMGTLLYMPPEQLHDAKSSDARSDIWALGVTLYELVTGKTPFGSDDMADTILRIEAARPHAHLNELRPDAPEALDQVIAGCLQPSPDKRFQTLLPLVEGLAPFSPAQAAISLERVAKLLGTRPSSGGSGAYEAVQAVSANQSSSPGAATPPGSTTPGWGNSKASEAVPAGNRRSKAPVVVLGAVLVAGVAAGAFALMGPQPPAQPHSVEAAAATQPSTAPTTGATGPTVTPVNDAAPSASAAPMTSASAVSPPVESAPRAKPALPSAGGKKPAEAPRPKAGCNPPYVIDATGMKRFKPECL